MEPRFDYLKTARGVYEAMLGLEKYLHQSGLEPSLRELVKLRASQLNGCAFCIDPCPFGALTLVEYSDNGQTRHRVQVNESLCKGCGVCMGTCPKGGIYVSHFRPEELSAEVHAALADARSGAPDGGEFEPVILALCCYWCSYTGADLAGTSRIQYPSNVRIVRVQCTGMINLGLVVDAFLGGADGVMVCGCHPGDCHYVSGNERAKSRAEAIDLMLHDFGLEPQRFRLRWVSASEGGRFAQLVKEMVDEVKAIGPSRYHPSMQREMDIGV